MRIHILVGVVFLAISNVAAHAEDDPLDALPEADASYLRQHLPEVVIAPAPSIKKLQDAGEWLPLDSSEFEFVKPGSKKSILELELLPTHRGPGSAIDTRDDGWSMRLPNGTMRYLIQSTGKGISAPTDVSTAHGFIIRLDPPEPIVQENLDLNVPMSREISVDIYDLHQPKSLAYSGKVRCTWTDLGGWRVKVPSGTYDTHLIRIEYNGSVGPASVNAKRYVFLAKGIGPVAFTDMRDISAFILFSEDHSQSGVLTKVKSKKS